MAGEVRRACSSIKAMPTQAAARQLLPEPLLQAGAYAVIEDSDGRVLTVEARNGRTYLPGGRIESGETPRRALVREIGEECGWCARVVTLLGRTVETIMDGAVTLQASHWRAELARPAANAAEHRLVWMDPAVALDRLHRDGDRKALLMAFPASSTMKREGS
jgi:8-oxo-dGTP pyrophosphatase MutT (NUDIX family)